MTSPIANMAMAYAPSAVGIAHGQLRPSQSQRAILHPRVHAPRARRWDRRRARVSRLAPPKRKTDELVEAGRDALPCERGTHAPAVHVDSVRIEPVDAKLRQTSAM